MASPRAAVNGAGTCSELASHLEPEGAKMGGEVIQCAVRTVTFLALTFCHTAPHLWMLKGKFTAIFCAIIVLMTCRLNQKKLNRNKK